MFWAIFGSFSILFDIFDLCILKFVFKRSIFLQRKILEARFEAPNSKFNFHFSERSTRISNFQPEIRTFKLLSGKTGHLIFSGVRKSGNSKNPWYSKKGNFQKFGGTRKSWKIQLSGKTVHPNYSERAFVVSCHIRSNINCDIRSIMNCDIRSIINATFVAL